MKKLLVLLCCVLLLGSLPISSLAAIKVGEDYSDPSKLTYYVYENDGFKVVDGAFVSKSANKYNACYFGEYFETCVYEFDFKDFGGGDHVGGASLRVGSARYDVEIRSDAKNTDEKIVIWKGGPNKKASNTMKSTGKGVPVIPEGQWVNVKIALTRDTIKVYIGDVLYLDYKDPLPYTAGGFGLRSANSNIGYDNMKIYDLADLKLDPKPVGNTSSKTESSKTADASQPRQNSASSGQDTADSSETVSTGESKAESIQDASENAASANTDSSAADTGKNADDNGNPGIYIVIGTVAVLIIAGAVYFLIRRKKA